VLLIRYVKDIPHQKLRKVERLPLLALALLGSTMLMKTVMMRDFNRK
jgi:hypothetical protein